MLEVMENIDLTPAKEKKNFSKRALLLLAFALGIIGSLLWFIVFYKGFSIRDLFFSEKPPLAVISENKSVLGAQDQDQRPQIQIYSKREGIGGGVIPFSSTDEPSIDLWGAGLSGQAEVSLYEASKESLLDYLVHDKDNKQLHPEFDASRFQFVKSFNFQIDSTKNSNSKLLLPISEAGVWFLRIKIGDTVEDRYIVRSKVGVLVKSGDQELVFWGQDFKSLKSVSSGKLEIYNLLDGKKKINESAFNKDGISKTPISADADIAIFEADNSISLIPLNLQYLNSGSSYKPFKNSQKEKYFIWTDRPLYHPGDTVYFKAILRNEDDVRFSIPSGLSLVKIYSGWDEKKTVFQQNLTISENGTISGEFKLPTDAQKGTYHLKTEILGTEPVGYFSSNTSFDVEYYQKPEAFLNLETDKNELINGNKVTLKFSAKYFFGAPLAQKIVKYKFSSTDYLGFDNYQFGAWYGKQISENQIELDKNGEAIVIFDAKLPQDVSQNQIFSIEAEADDGTGNTLFARKNILVYAGNFDISQESNLYGGKVNDVINFPIALRSQNNSDVSDVSLTAKVHRENWVSYQQKGEKFPLYKKEEEDLPDLNIKTNASGQGVFNFKPTKQGSYKLTVAGKDSVGNLVSKQFYIWISDEFQPYFDDSLKSLTIKQDKSQYLPTERAKLSIYSQVPNRDVFLSLERGRLNRFEVVHVSGNQASLDIPLTSTDMPNIFAQVSSFASNKLDTGSTELIIPASSKQLVVKIENQEKYGPGDTVNLNISTQDNQGNPVSAEVAVWAVDKALYELTDSRLGDVYQSFWKKRYNSTSDSQSLQGINSEMGGMGGGGGGSRSVFKDTAFWNPNVKTDETGKAQISFKLPDNLTTWVISGLGATTDTLAGQTASEIKVSKDIIIHPTVPNIFRIGDEIILSASVQNITEKDQEFDLGLSFDSGDVKTATYTGILVKSFETKEVSFTVLPKLEKPDSKLVFSAISTKDSKLGDIVQINLPTYKFGFWEKRAESGNNDRIYPLKFAPDSDKTKSWVSLNLSKSLGGSLLEEINYLTSYPYTCAEQTASRIIGALQKDKSEPNIDKVIKNSLNRLSQLQSSDGGWSWFGFGQSDIFITSYVVDSLNLAKLSGIKVNNLVLGSAQDFLEGVGSSDPNSISADEQIARAYALSALGSGKGQIFIPPTDNFSPDILALKLLTDIKNGNKTLQENDTSKLLEQAKTQGDEVYWEGGTKEHFGSKNTSTALAARALLAAGADKDILIKALKFLVKSNQSDYWTNTYATSQVLRTVNGYIKALETLNPSFSYAVLLDSTELERSTAGSLPNTSKELVIPLSKIKDLGSSVSVKKTGTGELYSTLLVNEYRTNPNLSALDHGLSLKREYINQRGAQIPLAIGDIVEVKLTLSGLSVEERYGVITDTLPSGLVPINTSFKNQQYQQTPQDFTSGQEVTEDGTVLSLYQVKPGENSFSYKARVVSAGKFLTPPATVSLMYSPEIYGRTQSQTVTVANEKAISPLPGLTPQSQKIQIIIISIAGLIIVVLVILKLRIKIRSKNKPISKP